MENAFKLSVVIPTYNEEERLPKTLARLESLGQTVTELEVVISDDGSSDQTLSVARQWASRFDPTAHRGTARWSRRCDPARRSGRPS